MTTDDLIRTIDAHFDDGVPLGTDVLARIAADETARAHYDALTRLEASIWDMPLEQPSADLFMRVQTRITEQRMTPAIPWADICGAASAAAAVLVLWQWLVPISVQAYDLWQGIADWIPAAPDRTFSPVLSQSIADTQARLWNFVEQSSFEVSPTAALLFLAGGMAVLTAFNGFEAARVRGQHRMKQEGA